MKIPKRWHVIQNDMAKRVYRDMQANAIGTYNVGMAQLRTIYDNLKAEALHTSDKRYRNQLWARYCAWKNALKAQRRDSMKAADSVWLMMTGEKA